MMTKTFEQQEIAERAERIENIENHTAICAELSEIHARKNEDYGNSFSEQYQEHGITSSVIRLDDKMRRIKQLVKNDAKVAGESIEDTLLDLANYSIMTLMELRK